ncbi:MAG: PKD domain-containing protein [Bacteroidota bacterium]
MKKYFFIILFLFESVCYSQNPIPYGISKDSFHIKEMYGSSINDTFRFYYYKPTTYDPSVSLLLFAIHGNGGNGLSPINDLQIIAERRKAIIISPNIGGSDLGYCCRQQEPVYLCGDTMSGCSYYGAASDVFKQVYRHTLERENRDSIQSYLIGFSAGGQFVSRYMLIRQAYPDSIPLQMAVSSSAYFYTFPTDTLNGVEMIYMCGFAPNPGYWDPYPGLLCPGAISFYIFFCNKQTIQYYNEIYGVLICNADTQYLNDTVSPCSMEQGTNRYERAKNFYNFCDTNAVNIGTVLQWRYDSVAGVGHNQNAMYNTKRNITDSSTIAETLLFDTPYHNVPQIAPLARFNADTTEVTLPYGTVNFINTSINASSYFWDFGDSTTSTDINPTHIYTTLPSCWSPCDSYTVQLTAYDSADCSNWCMKRHYIKVNDTTTNVENIFCEKNIKVYPNPADNECTINFQTNGNENDFSVQVLNYLGQDLNVSQNIFTDVNSFFTKPYLLSNGII